MNKIFVALLGFCLSLSANELPYAQDLIFQSTEAVEANSHAFDGYTDQQLAAFISQSRKGQYDAAYQTWEDLLFRSFSKALEWGATMQNTPQESLKQFLLDHRGDFVQSLQAKILKALPTFLQNGLHAELLKPDQRLFTESILKSNAENIRDPKQLEKALNKLASLEKEPFTRAQGTFKPVDGNTLSSLRVLTANVICFPDYLPYFYGGISPWKDRIDALADKIRGANAEIVCLQEMWDPEAMRTLADRLKDDYAFFVYGAGQPCGTLDVHKMGYGSGLWIASKVPLDSVEFMRFPRSIPEGSNRGFLMATCTCKGKRIAFMNTHLQHGEDPEMVVVRKEQLLLSYAGLQLEIARSSFGFLLGDLNVDGKRELESSGLSSLFQVSEWPVTCTNYFTDLVMTPIAQRGSVVPFSERLDYCVIPKLSAVKVAASQEAIDLYSLDQPTGALSDHQGLLTVFQL